MITRRGFFGLLGAALVVPKPGVSSVDLIFDPPLHISMHNEVMASAMFDKLLVDISRSYNTERQVLGYWADSIFPIVKEE